MSVLRVGITGARFAAGLHRLAYRRVYGVEARLVAVASPPRSRWPRACGTSHVPFAATMPAWRSPPGSSRTRHAAVS